MGRLRREVEKKFTMRDPEAVCEAEAAAGETSPGGSRFDMLRGPNI